MNNKLVANIGIIGVVLFAIAAVVGGLLIDNYSEISQFISESFAVDTEYGRYLQYVGYVPSGILITIFCFNAFKFFPTSKSIKAGFCSLGIFYGLGTILVGIFPCDTGCNVNMVDPSMAQLIHNATAALSYIFIPISMIGISLGLKLFPNYKRLYQIAITAGIISAFFIYMLLSNPESEFRGLLQRIIESIFILWIVSAALKIKNGSGGEQ